AGLVFLALIAIMAVVYFVLRSNSEPLADGPLKDIKD
ncbi:MAG: hypothetical protein ACI9HK_002680, partial [Pirellulaceae bacterium]